MVVDRNREVQTELVSEALKRGAGSLERETGTLERGAGSLERETGSLEREAGLLERATGSLVRETTVLERRGFLSLERIVVVAKLGFLRVGVDDTKSLCRSSGSLRDLFREESVIVTGISVGLGTGYRAS